MTRFDRFDPLAGSGISRRRFVQGAAALGLAAPLSARRRPARVPPSRRATRSFGSRRAAPSKCSTTTATGSPRRWATSATSRPSSLPAILEATSSSKAVAEARRHVAIVSPGVFSLGIEAGIDLVSVFHDGGLRRLRLRRASRARTSPRSPNSEARRSPSATPAGPRSPIRCSPRRAAIIGIVQYVAAGAAWGPGAGRRAGRRRPLLGRPARAVDRARVSTSITSWARTGPSSRPTPSRSAAPTSRTRRSPISTPAICAAGRWGWSSATTTRAPPPRSP